jgi:hypothetical protein
MTTHNQQTEQVLKHTPLPWLVSRNNAGARPLHFQPPEILGRNAACCVASQFGNGPEAEANAEFICRAVNSHYELVESLQQVAHILAMHGSAYDKHDPSTAVGNAFAVLAKAQA